MKLGFEESQSPYESGSQNARAWTESWVRDRLYCPNCAQPNLTKFSNNSPVADFFCGNCVEEFELKSQKARFGKKVMDGAYKTKCDRLAARNNPNLLLLQYDLGSLAVTNLIIIPKHFFVLDIIEQRKPLGQNARRAGWVGSNILLHQIPASGRIHIIQNSIVRPQSDVLQDWQRTLFLRETSLEARGWLIEVMKCVEALNRNEFNLDDVYTFEMHLASLYPNNRHVKQKIRQQLQVLRDKGYIEFVARGRYRLTSRDA